MNDHRYAWNRINCNLSSLFRIWFKCVWSIIFEFLISIFKNWKIYMYFEPVGVYLWNAAENYMHAILFTHVRNSIPYSRAVLNRNLKFHSEWLVVSVGVQSDFFEVPKGHKIFIIAKVLIWQNRNRFIPSCISTLCHVTWGPCAEQKVTWRILIRIDTSM